MHKSGPNFTSEHGNGECIIFWKKWVFSRLRNTTNRDISNAYSFKIMKVCSKDSEFSCDSDKLYEKLRRRLKPEMETGSRPEVRGKSKKVLFLKFSWSLNSYLVFSRCSWYRKCPNQTGSWFKIAYEDMWLFFCHLWRFQTLVVTRYLTP